MSSEKLNRADCPNWIELLPEMVQRQDSTAEQLTDLRRVAVRLGMYDGADALEAARKEAEYWRLVASYLASCHAATLEWLPKSAPKSLRSRLASICGKAARYLRKKDSPPRAMGLASIAEHLEWETKRCEDAVAKYGGGMAGGAAEVR